MPTSERVILGWVVLLGLMALTSTVPAAELVTPVLFVATNGNDNWSGHFAPNRDKTDGPFATVQRAIQAARQYKGATIYVRSGFYFLTEPVVLKPEDSGLTVAGWKAEHPVLSGGRRLTSWKQATVSGKQVWVAEIHEVRSGQWYFRELWVNGRRATRARHPNHGYLKVAELVEPSSDWTKGQMQFRFNPGDLQASPTVTNAEVVVMSRWVESRLPIFSIDESNRMLRFAKKSVFELAKNDTYYAEGALEFLDEPGEWYLDRSSGTVYYMPRPGETLAHVEAIAPRLSQVLRLEGEPQSGKFVERVTFRNVAFEHTEWYFPEGFATDKSAPNIWPPPKPEVGGFAQAAIGVPGAVWGQGARDCSFENCRFTRLGNYGLELARGCQQNRIIGCEFSDLGAGGIKLGETSIRSEAAEQAEDNEVRNCAIHDGGKFFHSAIGIWIGQSPGNRLLHNLIHDFYYTGISIGWTWGYGPALATNNLVAFNHVHHIGVKSDGDGPILSDMGGIYTLGMQPGTRILNNLWHDIAGRDYGGWGIYFDEGSSSIVAESNIVYRTTHGGFHQHYGATNFVQNNIFAFARDQQLQRTRPEPHPSFTFSTNIVYFGNGVLLGGNWSNDNYNMDWNMYFDARAATPEIKFAGQTLQEWQARGHDRHSLLRDPLFIAPQQGDFRLRPSSPAFQIGFKPIDVSPIAKDGPGASH